MGKLDDDKFKILFIINALNLLPALQSTISELLQSSPSITSTDVKNRVIQEEQLLACHERLGLPLAPGLVNNTALTAITNKPWPICANCKHANHCTEFCIAVMYMPPRDRQTARRAEKSRAEEWTKSEDGITETMAGPNRVYTHFVSTSPSESEQDDAAAIGFMRSHD